MVLGIVGLTAVGVGIFCIVGFALYEAIQELKRGYYAPLIVVGSIILMFLGAILVALSQVI